MDTNSKITNKITLMEAVRPITLTNAIFGIGVIEIPFGRPSILITYIYAIINITSYGFAAYFSLNKTSDFEISSNVRQFMCKVILFGNCFLTLATIFLSLLRFQKSKHCLEIVKNADDLMETVGIHKNYVQSRRRYIIKILTLLITFTIIMFINASFMFVKNTPIGTRIVLTYATHYPLILMHLADHTFLSIARYAGESFERMNKLLLDVLRGCNQFTNEDTLKIIRINRFLISSKTDYSRIISIIRQCHLEMIRICRTANTHFGLHILLSLSFAFIMVTGLIYNIYIGLFLSDIPFNKFVYELISIVCWLFFYSTKILLLTYVCSTTVTEATKTGEIIPEISMHTELREESLQFLMQMIQNPLQFTANGFCTVDYTLIRQMSGTIMTYLVILIQFSDSSIPSITSHNSMHVQNTSLLNAA